MVLETGRLRLRAFTEDDVDNLFDLHNDPEVMRFINGGRPAARETIETDTIPAILAGYARWPYYGHWAATARATGEFIGWFEFRPPDDGAPGDVELGYRLHRSAWGQGYATEGSRALVHKGFTELGVRRVVATTMTVNLGSRRVLEKVGLRLVRTVHLPWPEAIDGAEHGDVEYELRRADWRR